MNSKAIKEMQDDIRELQKALSALGKLGIDQQKRHSEQLSEIKHSLIEAHEKDKGRFDTILADKNKEIEDLKKAVKP